MNLTVIAGGLFIFFLGVAFLYYLAWDTHRNLRRMQLEEYQKQKKKKCCGGNCHETRD